MSAISNMVNQYLAQQQRREELEAQDRLASRSGRNQMIGTGLGALGSLGGAYLGSDAGSAALSSALGLGGATTAAATPAAGSAVLNPITSAITNAASGAGATGGVGASLGAVAPYVAPAIGAYGAYDLLSDDANRRKDQGGEGALQGAASGAAMGSMFGPWGIAIGGGLGGLAGFANAAFGSGGDPNARERRDIRGDELADFYTDDNRLQFGGVDADVGQLGANGSYNVDLTEAGNLDSELAQTIGGLNPLMTLALGDRDPNRASDFAGELANAITATGDPGKDVQAAYSELGYDRDKAYTEVLNMEGLDSGTRDAYLAAIDDVFGVENPNKGKGVDAQGRLDTGV